MKKEDLPGITKAVKSNMKKAILKQALYICLSIVSFNSLFASSNFIDKGWKAGVARTVITPEESIWLAGYASRDRPSEGTLHDLWGKALALQDSEGKTAVLITTDLLGFPKKISDNIRGRISKKYDLEISDIILSSSHTHTGPVLMDALFDIYPLDDTHIEIIKNYSDKLENTLVELTGEAIKSMAPAHLYSENGVVRFQVNRRNNKAADLHNQTELKGPNDHAVPVMKVTDKSGNLVAILFGYACHTTVLNTYKFSGDYAGFAKIELEKLYPGTTAMFFQGAGADQNPLPRRTIALAMQYGRELAAAVDRVLNEEMKKLDPHISTAYSEIDLGFSSLPDKTELINIMEEATAYKKRWAANQLDILKEGGSLINSYPYPVQVWNLGGQPLMILGGELVVEYAIELKKIFGHEIFVMGYANDVMGYIPSETILEEGDYEGESSQMVYGLPAKWSPGLQARILNEFVKLSEQAGVKPIVNDL